MKLSWSMFLRHYGERGIRARFRRYGGKDSMGMAIPSQHLANSSCRYLRALIYVFNAHTLIMLGISLVAVYCCLLLNLRWNMDFSLVATGTVFPLTYTISQAFGTPGQANGCDLLTC
jgi:hypothetical protein